MPIIYPSRSNFVKYSSYVDRLERGRVGVGWLGLGGWSMLPQREIGDIYPYLLDINHAVVCVVLVTEWLNSM